MKLEGCLADGYAPPSAGKSNKTKGIQKNECLLHWRRRDFETNPDEEPNLLFGLDTSFVSNLALSLKLKYGAWPN